MTKSNIKMGKITLPMDVRNSNDIPAFEDMLSNGPMAIVLVYADWCGHCTTYKKNVWGPLKKTKGRNVNMASVHYDQLANTSLNNSKINGYPSVLLIGNDKKPATFDNNNEQTNAMPEANNLKVMTRLVKKNNNNNNSNNLPLITSTLDIPVRETNYNSPNSLNTGLATLNTTSMDNYATPMNNSGLNATPMNNYATPMNNAVATPMNNYATPMNNAVATPMNNAFGNRGLNAGPMNNATVNSGLNAGPMNNAFGNRGLNAGPMNNATVNNDLNAGPINNAVVNIGNSGNNSNNGNSGNSGNSGLAMNNSQDVSTVSSPPLIEEDVVTNVKNNTQGTTPILRGGRLYTKLSKRRRKHKRKSTHKKKRSSSSSSSSNRKN